MLGSICKWDVLAHPIVTIRCFGWRVFFRTMVAGRRQTFLSLLSEANAFGCTAADAPEVVGRCVELERSAGRIYQAAAQRFHEPEAVRQLFETLASQEEGHAELLELCRAAAAPGKWVRRALAGWLDTVARLEAQMRHIEAQLDALGSVQDALRLVLQIESSEVNQVYLAILGASDSAFVRRLNVFRRAGIEHIDYACRSITELAPDLAEECRRLRAQYAETARGPE